MHLFEVILENMIVRMTCYFFKQTLFKVILEIPVILGSLVSNALFNREHFIVLELTVIELTVLMQNRYCLLQPFESMGNVSV